MSCRNSHLLFVFTLLGPISKGLDGLIINPLDKRMMANMIAAEALAGRDEYCMNYLQGHRAGRFEF